MLMWLREGEVVEVGCCNGLWWDAVVSREVEKEEAGVKDLLRSEGALDSWGVDWEVEGE